MSSTEHEQQIGPYVIIEKVGSGGFANVYKARHAKTGMIVALKSIARAGIDNDTFFFKEVGLIRMIDHPFIAQFYQIIEDETNYYIAMEYVPNGNLLELVNVKGGLEENVARKLFLELIVALQYLHKERKIAHRDLKPENLLLDKNYNLKLIDFGLSKSFNSKDKFFSTACGSPAYVAPEIIKEKPYTIATDIWASGILLYAMTCGTLPFFSDNIGTMLKSIITLDPKYPFEMAPDLRDLLSRIFEKDPTKRITLEEIFYHPWVRKAKEFNFYVQDPSPMEKYGLTPDDELDVVTCQKMDMAGYKVENLLNEIQTGVVTERTAVYKMFRRQQICDDLAVALTFQTCNVHIRSLSREYSSGRALISGGRTDKSASPTQMNMIAMRAKVLRLPTLQPVSNARRKTLVNRIQIMPPVIQKPNMNCLITA